MSEQAGSASEDPTAPPRGTRRGWVFVVLAVVLVLAGALFGREVLRGEGAGRSMDTGPAPGASPTGTGSTSAAALDCPAAHAAASAVPAEPSGVDGAASLVPGRTPDTAVVCRYDAATNADFAPPTDGAAPPPPRTPPYPLTGSRALTTDLQRLTADLFVAAAGDASGRPCTMMAGPSSLYLVGLTYGSGRLWVAAEQEVNRCTGATNGVFATPAYLGDVIAKAYDAAAWTGWAAPEGSCAAPVVGRGGADREIVPGEPTVLTVCEQAANPDQSVSSDGTAGGQRVRALHGPDIDPVLRSVRALPASALGATRDCPDQKPDASYEVVASYAAGPAVRVSVQPGCTPAVTTDTLQAPEAGAVVAAIKAATGW